MAMWRSFACALVLLAGAGCSHGSATALREEPEEGIRIKGGSATARIWALIGKGQFAEAQALIAEGAAAGWLARPESARMLERITQLNTKLGQLPASIQRAPNFPSQLKDFTLFELQQLLDKKDFSLATQAQLQMAVKLLKEPDRLMEKVRNMPK